MDKNKNELIFKAVPDQSSANELLARLFDVVEPGAVFSKPVENGEYTVITASEVTVAMGVGYGGGAGTSPSSANTESSDTKELAGEALGVGGGGGGGGTATGRPVAVISIGPNGVQVEPILDPTKLGVALFTVIGSILLAGARMRKLGRKRAKLVG